MYVALCNGFTGIFSAHSRQCHLEMAYVSMVKRTKAMFVIALCNSAELNDPRMRIYVKQLHVQ